MAREHRSVVAVVSVGGVVLSDAAVAGMPHCRVLGMDVVRGHDAVCMMIHIAHRCGVDELRGALDDWAGARGWSAAVAPCSRSG